MRRLTKFSLAYLHDVAMSGLAFLLAWLFRMGGIDADLVGRVVFGTSLFTLTAAVCLLLLGSRGSIWRYSSLTDLLAILRSASATVVAFVIASFLLTRLDDIPRSVPIMAWFTMIVLLGAPRLIYRTFRDRMLLSVLRGGPRNVGEPILLFAAGDEAEAFIRALAKQKSPPYRAVGIIDRRRRYLGRSIRDVPVVGTLEALHEVLPEMARRYGVKSIVLTRRKFEDDSVEVLVEAANAHNMIVCRIPDITRLEGATDPSAFKLEAIRIEDLLGRKAVNLNIDGISDMIAQRRVLITGAGGSIGSELSRQIAAYGPSELILVDHSEYNLYLIDQAVGEEQPHVHKRSVICSVRNRARTMAMIDACRPDLVFHAAALKHVPLVESNPGEGILTNVFGTRNVADACLAAGVAAMVVISTDKAINPTSVMGASKRIAEAYCQALDVEFDGGDRSTRFLTVRFGNVLGSTGSVVPLFERQIRRGGPVTVTHPEIKRYFMTIPEAVQLVLQASVHGLSHRENRGDIFVLDMGKPIKIIDLARQMIRLSGAVPDLDIPIVFTGLRPGEKLFEELFDTVEPLRQTAAEGVLIASPRIVDRASLERSLVPLEKAATDGDEVRLRAVIKQIVPEFAHETQRGKPDLRVVRSDDVA